MASEGYPETVEKGHSIRGLSQANSLDNVVVFMPQQKQADESETILTSGGRVLGVTAHANLWPVQS